MDADGKYFHITNIKAINEILSRMGLPQVKKGAQELVSITGSDSHKNLYRWDDYPKGILILERTICKNKQTLETFNCLAAITIRQKYRQ
jgi:nicotinic acid mononucleotide adenylyltransferase